MTAPSISDTQTPRLKLRRWSPADIEPFHKLNADPAVMQFFPAPLTRDESQRLFDRIQNDFARDSFGLWAVDVQAAKPTEAARHAGFAGFVGITRTSFDPNQIEIAWRLAVSFQHRGLATEAAAAALQIGFERFGLDRIVAFTAKPNFPSRRLMERLGMQFTDEFLHPALPPEHWLAPHVRFVMTRKEWQRKRLAFPFLDSLRSA